jgi:hypothetical protein
MIVIDGLPLSMDTGLQQYRKRNQPHTNGTRHSTQPLSGSRAARSNLTAMPVGD